MVFFTTVEWWCWCWSRLCAEGHGGVGGVVFGHECGMLAVVLLLVLVVFVVVVVMMVMVVVVVVAVATSKMTLAFSVTVCMSV